MYSPRVLEARSLKLVSVSPNQDISRAILPLERRICCLPLQLLREKRTLLAFLACITLISASTFTLSPPLWICIISPSASLCLSKDTCDCIWGWSRWYSVISISRSFTRSHLQRPFFHIQIGHTYRFQELGPNWASLMVQMVRKPPRMLETEFDPWFGKIRWRREWLPTPIFLSGEFHGQRSLVGYDPCDCRIRHNWATNTHTGPNYL